MIPFFAVRAQSRPESIRKIRKDVAYMHVLRLI